MSSFLLAFLSYTPLWLLVAIRDFNSILTGDRKNLVAEWTGMAVIALLGLIGFVWACLASRKAFVSCDASCERSEGSFKLLSCKEQKTVTVEFVVKNILPMLVFDSTTAEGLALILAYFLVIASLSVKHRHFPPNVVVEWLGWTFYECTIEKINGETVGTRIVLSRKTLCGVNQVRELIKVNNETYAVKGGMK